MSIPKSANILIDYFKMDIRPKAIKKVDLEDWGCEDTGHIELVSGACEPIKKL